MVLEAFQREMVAEMFGGATETLILLPKKNGKSTLLGALALFHLCTTSDAECVIAAASRDQAQIMLRQAQGFIRRSKWLQARLVVKQREIVHPMLGGRVRVLASDVDTADGVIPTLALVDELHRHKTADLYGIFRDGLLGDAKMVTISTAGATASSALGVLRKMAHELPLFERTGVRNTARSADGAFVMYEWCLLPDQDVEDMELVAEANPAPWQTPKTLARRHDSPSMTPWQWKRYACGIWTEGEEPWIDPQAWDGCKSDLPMPDVPMYLGVDLGVKHDSTAIVQVARDGETFTVRSKVLSPRPDGAVSIESVEDEIRKMCETHRVSGVVFDPWSFRRSAEMLESDGIPMIEHPMSAERMSVASSTLYSLVENGSLRHDGDPVLRAHVLAGVTKESERGWRLVKDPKLKRPIDALIALAIACQVASSDVGRSKGVAFL